MNFWGSSRLFRHLKKGIFHVRNFTNFSSRFGSVSRHQHSIISTSEAVSRKETGNYFKQELERNWQGAPNVMDGQGPWYAMLNDDTRYETLLFDIIEAYDFIPKEEGSSDESSD